MVVIESTNEVRKIPYGTFDESGHDSDAEAAAAHYEDFDELAPSLEVLRHHQRRAVACQAYADAYNRPWYRI